MTALSLALFVVGTRANLDLSLTQELRARSHYAGDVRQNGTAGDIWLTPSATGELAVDQTRLKLSYFPRFIIPEFYARFQPLTLHRAIFSLGSAFGGRSDFSFD